MKPLLTKIVVHMKFVMASKLSFADCFILCPVCTKTQQSELLIGLACLFYCSSVKTEVSLVLIPLSLLLTLRLIFCHRRLVVE